MGKWGECPLFQGQISTHTPVHTLSQCMHTHVHTHNPNVYTHVCIHSTHTYPCMHVHSHMHMWVCRALAERLPCLRVSMVH